MDSTTYSPPQLFHTLLPPHWKREVEGWIRDDVPSIDIGGLVVGDKPEEAHLFGKSGGVLAGVPFFNAVFEHLGCTVEWHIEEGKAPWTFVHEASIVFLFYGPADLRRAASPGDVVDPSKADGKVRVATVRGPARLILLGERTALNSLSRASGVASAARRAASLALGSGWHGHVAGTRKTTPGFRIVEK